MVTYPQDWNDVTVGDLVKTYGGLSGKRKEDFENGRRPFITYMDVYSRSVIRQPSGMVRVDESEYQNFVSPGDLLFTQSSETPDEVGKVATYSGMGQPFLNSFCFGGTPRQKFDANFLVQFLSHGAPRQAITLLAQGSTRYNLAPGRLLTLKISIPAIREQRAIAEVLSGFDEHLANLDELITKKKAIRDGALEGLMSRDLRLDGYNMPWAVRSLDEIAHSRRESSTGDPMDMDVELENLLPGEGQVVGDTSVRTAASFIFHPGDVLFGRLRPYLKKYWLATCSGLRSGEIWALAAKDGIDPRFLFHLVRTQRFLDAAGKTMGTKMPRADWSLLKTESFEVPEVDEQRAIAEVLSGMDEEIRLLAEERAKVERLKLGAMDDLLTGRVRLPLAKEAA